MPGALDDIAAQLLVLRSQVGDDGAFAELVRRYDAPMRYYLRRLLVGSADVEDAVQDTWLRVFRGLPGLRQPRAFKAWLFRIARDRALLERRKRRFPREILSPTGVLPENVATSAEGNLNDATDRSERLRRAMDQLPSEQREVLVLRYVVGLRYADLARVLACPIGTVRSRLHYACRALRARIRPEEVSS